MCVRIYGCGYVCVRARGSAASVTTHNAHRLRCLKMQVSFRTRATNSRALLRGQIALDVYIGWRRCLTLQVVFRKQASNSRALFCGQIALDVHIGWRRCIGCFKLKVYFRKRAANSRALLRKMTYKDKAPCEYLPPCTCSE